MESVITFLNITGKSFIDFSTSMLIQSSVLIILLLVLNVFLRKKVRVIFLYGIWMLVLVKLVLPTTLWSPVGVGNWIGDKVPGIITEKAASVNKQITTVVQRVRPVSKTVLYGLKITDLSSIDTSPEHTTEASAEFTARASPTTVSLSWQAFAFIGWLAVVSAMVLLLIRRMFIIKGQLAKSKKPDDSMLGIFDQCRKQMGVNRPVLLELSPIVVSPSVWGLFRPKILIPQKLPRKLKANELKSVLLHELAHIKRGDVWVNLIQTILQIAYFYNPLLWVANVIIRKVRELAVDEMVLVAMGEKAEDYPETLLNISRMTFGRSVLNLRLIGIIESKKALERRIMNMLNRPVPKSSKLGICGLIAIVVIGAVILPMGYNPVERTALSASFMKDRNEGGIIIPGLRVGDYTFGMSKDEVLRKLGEPEDIFCAGEKYTLDNLPRKYYMVFDDISFCINDDSVTGITALSPSYKFPNGLGVGDSEDKIKQAFGSDFQLEEFGGKDILTYKDKGIQFEIRNTDKTVIEINVYPAKRDHEEGENGTSDVNRKIAQICTGPADFNDVIKIFGQPSGYDYGGRSFKLEDLPVERYWIRYTDSIHVFMRRGKVEELEIVDPAYVFNGKIPMGSSLERVLSIVGQPKEIVEGEQGWEDCVLYKSINGRVGWCQYRREDLNADFRFLNYTLKCVHILEINSSSATAGRAAKGGSFKTVKTIKSVNEFEDVRSKDLSKVDLSSSKGLIATLSFNQQTVWPEQNKMPTGSGPQKILTDAMNPGLGIRKLHQQGITGKGVNVAIIDQPLLLDHPEYNGKIVAYYDTGCGPSKSSMHGPAVASLLVGTNCGTAPDARVYYVAAPSWSGDTAYYAKGLDWIIEQNEKLPSGEKIRVVSVSAAPSGPGSPFKKNREMWDQACGRAEAEGIMVLDCTNSHRGFINRGWYDPGHPESVIKFNPGPPPRRDLRVDPTEMSIYIPSSCRTTAQHYDYHGRDSYIYWGRGGLSWSIPYCAGVLAMGWQIRPDLTPAQMKEMLFASAYVHKSSARIINPTAFIELVRNKSGNQHIRVRPQTNSGARNIVPGLRVGEYTLGMSKDEILRKLGEPEAIQLGLDHVDVVRRGEERYSLNNLSGHYILCFGDIFFWFEGDSAEMMISVRSPLYKLSNGLAVGDSEQKIKQAFGENFRLEKVLGKDFLCYHTKGLAFEINEKNQTVAQIVVYKPEGDRHDSDEPDQQGKTNHTIVPGLRVGEYNLGMSKEEVMKKLGEPEHIHLGGEQYTLNNLPRKYIMSFGDISFGIEDDTVTGVSVRSPLYKFTNGLGVGNSEEEIKRAFGNDFQLGEYGWKNQLNYKDKGIQFEIRNEDKMVIEIDVYQSESNEKTRTRPQMVSESQIIIPGERVGSYTIGMSKEDVLRKMGEPKAIQLEEDGEVIQRGEERYNLNNRECLMIYSDISFGIEEDSVEVIMVRSPLYKLSNGLIVGDSEQKVNQAFGKEFKLEEALGKVFRCYHARGLAFEIHKNTQTVAQILVYGAEGNRGDPDVPDSAKVALVRQAAKDGRISYKLTTPDEFKAIVGRPTREWTEGDDLVYMEYPGIKVGFFGKPELWPHTLVRISCEGREIDIGRNRPIVLRNEDDLDKFGTFWGYSSVDLSRLDLSQKGELLKTMPFDSRTVWPESDRLPSDFDPEAVMEWGKYPGLGIKQLHDQGVTGKGVHVAIIDQPLLLGHVEYKDQLVSYKEIQTGNADPQMHGPPVASIFVGKTCGVAPEAILHYWAEPSWKMDYKYRCIALEQIIQFNRGKEKSKQIRVVSVSKGFSPSEPNLDRWKTLLEKAKESGIYVVHCSSMGFGAGCRFMKDSDDPANYRLCSFYGGDVYRESGTFFTPIDHRTTASQRARDAYTFWTRGGLSWGAPYYAGVVALGIQVNPDLRPDQIDKLLYDSGWDFQKGKLINPVGFVKAARAAGADGS